MKLEKDGFEIIEEVYSKKEIAAILQILEEKKVAKQFGVRAFLKSYPTLIPLVFNENLCSIIGDISKKAQLIKSIYFDKPPNANWIVNWHQDLTINVDKKIDAPEFKNWRILKDRTVVQPPLEILENIFTIRIHLDDCKKENGALRVMEQSHTVGVIDIKNGINDWKEKEVVCEVSKGGILKMKPLILHASKRTENNQNRRVIHLEFCDKQLPDGVFWQESLKMPNIPNRKNT